MSAKQEIIEDQVEALQKLEAERHSDSVADAWGSVVVILCLVSAILFWVSGQ